LADDLVWVATGSSPVAGTYKGKQVYLEKIIKRLGDRLQSGGPSLWWRTFSWTETLHAFSSMAKAEWVKMVRIQVHLEIADSVAAVRQERDRLVLRFFW
jgi:hypothetical protein